MPTWKDPLVLVVGALVLVPVVAAIVSALRNPWAPSNDWALIELQVRAVGTADTPLLGTWSRFGWDHPGPWPLWLLAGFYRLVPAEHGLLFAAGMVNLVALAGCVAMALRRPRAQALVLLVGLAALVRGLGIAGVGDPWNPILPILPFALYCLVCVEVAIGPRRWMLAVAAAAGSFAVQAHIGFSQPVVLVGVTAAGLAWWKARRDRADAAAEGDDASGPAPSTPPARRLRAGVRALWPAAAVLVVAWLPVAIDQVAGQGNLGMIVRWAAGADGGGSGVEVNEGRFGTGEVVRSAAWLLEPLGLWIGRFVQPTAFGFDLLGNAAPATLLWVPLALAGGVLLARRLPAVMGWPAVCCATVAAAGVLGVVTDLATAEGLPVSWPFRWAAVPVMLVWVSLGWSVVGLVAERAAGGRAVRVGRRVVPGLSAGLAAVTAVVVGVTLWRGSLGEQPEQQASGLLLRLTPAIEATAREEDLVVANSAIMLDKADIGLPVILERAGIEWVERDDPRAAGRPVLLHLRRPRPRRVHGGDGRARPGRGGGPVGSAAGGERVGSRARPPPFVDARTRPGPTRTLRADGAPEGRSTQPPLTASSSSATTGAGSSAPASHPAGRVTEIGPDVFPRGRASAPSTTRRAGAPLASAPQRLVQLGHRRRGGEAPADLAAHGVALQVPAHVLADVADRHRLGPATRPAARRWRASTRVTSASGGASGTGAAGERPGQVAEQPRPAQAAPADDHAVAAGLVRSCAGRRRPPRCRRCPAPGRRARAARSSAIARQSARPRVVLLGGAGVQGHRGRALVLGDAPGVEERRAGARRRRCAASP